MFRTQRRTCRSEVIGTMMKRNAIFAFLTVAVASVCPAEAKGRTELEAGMSSDDCVGLRYGDGVADATEGIVASIATAGGNDKIVFAAGDRVVKDDLGGDEIAFGDFRAF